MISQRFSEQTMARIYTIPNFTEVAELHGAPPPVDVDNTAGIQLDPTEVDHESGGIWPLLDR
jgi:hypothetical protein